MSLLGEIVKNTQALRYHAKSTEIAGTNLTHVDDENYARQRVLAREGSMYRSVGTLSTAALEMGGLDHARSALLDRRVVSEVGETASLEARKEVLDLLQSALGERIIREGVNAHLDDQHESFLAPGSLTRALNDFFNSFQELSASPDESSIRKELYHKVHTLGKRFNEAGEKFEEIEGDLTETVNHSVTQVNAILEKLYEVNKQIRRFELQDKGKAVTYRDRRQQLLESLSKLLDVKVEEDIDPKTKKPSGLINLFVTGARGEKVNLLDPQSSKKLDMDWGQEFAVTAPADSKGTVARVRAKIGADGKLGRVEVLDGGSKYSDRDGPILVGFAPPERKEILSTAIGQVQAAAGGAATAAEAINQAGQPVDVGPDLGANVGTVPAVEAGTAPVIEAVPPAPANLSNVGLGYADTDAPLVAITGDDKGTLQGKATVNKGTGTLDITFTGNPSGTGSLTVEVADGAVIRNPTDLSGVGSGFVPPLLKLPNVGSDYDPVEIAPAVTITGTDQGTLKGIATINPDGTLNIDFSGASTGNGNLTVQVAPGTTGGTTLDQSVTSGPVPTVTIQGTDKGTLEGTATVNPDGTLNIAFSGTAAGTGELSLVATVHGTGVNVPPIYQPAPLQATRGTMPAQSVNDVVPAAASTGTAPFSYVEGEVFNHDGNYYQALTSTAKGDNLSDELKFLKLTSIPKGEQVREYSSKYSVVESYAKGEQFYQEGKLYQAVSESSPVAEESGADASRAYTAGDVILHGGTYFQAIEEIELGQTLPPAGTTAGDKEIEAKFHFLSLGNKLPSIDMSEAELVFVSPFDNQEVKKGQYLFHDNKFYLSTGDFKSNPSLESNPTVPSRFDPSTSPKVVEVTTYVEAIKSIDRTQSSLRGREGEVLYDAGSDSHYIVKTSFEVKSAEQMKKFDPSDQQWEHNLRKFTPKLAGGDKTAIFRRTDATIFDPERDKWAVEVNLGLAEAIVRKGEIVGFSLLGQGQGYPPPDALFVGGVELALRSGSIHGYQRVRLEEMESFRQHLNTLAKNFVTKVNQSYNPEDEPGGYLFGFDAYLGRAAQGANEIMEDEYDLPGVEGDGEFILFRDEVDMTLPYPEKETFMVTYSTPVFPEQFAGQVPFVRGSNETELQLENPDFVKIYGSARRMKHVTLENDFDYPGADGAPGTDDDGRSVMIGYEKIPFRIQQGDKSFIFGDNFHFEAVPANSWNVAKSMRVDDDFTIESIKSTVESADGANEVALAISELSNDEFTDRVSNMNTTIGNALADVGDNLQHQHAVERLLLDERQAVSSVSIDEEVADLMRYQRSFQASARVLSTLDRMLELVVMGLTR